MDRCQWKMKSDPRCSLIAVVPGKNLLWLVNLHLHEVKGAQSRQQPPSLEPGLQLGIHIPAPDVMTPMNEPSVIPWSVDETLTNLDKKNFPVDRKESCQLGQGLLVRHAESRQGPDEIHKTHHHPSEVPWLSFAAVFTVTEMFCGKPQVTLVWEYHASWLQHCKKK